MIFSPIQYDEPVFRPPAEANSLIFQVTTGCSWNKCAFCEMYTMKKFRVKEMNQIINDIKQSAELFPRQRKFFLADGNATILSTNKLLMILNTIKDSFANIQRISSYALPGDIISKSQQELTELKAAGLDQLYVGIESGDGKVLEMIQKGETYQSTITGLLKAKQAGIKLSVILINGLAGLEYTEQHALNSAKIVNEIQPEFLSNLVLGLAYGVDEYRKRFKGKYIPMSYSQLLHELKQLLLHTALKQTIFRSDHVSNYITLKGILSRDKEKLLQQINEAEKIMDDTIPQMNSLYY